MLQRLPNNKQLQFTPGRDASYSNPGYKALWTLIEEVNRKHYKDYSQSPNPIVPLQKKSELKTKANQHHLFVACSDRIPHGDLFRSAILENIVTSIHHNHKLCLWDRQVTPVLSVPSSFKRAIRDSLEILMWLAVLMWMQN